MKYCIISSWNLPGIKKFKAEVEPAENPKSQNLPLRFKKNFIWNLISLLIDWFCPKWWCSRKSAWVKLGILYILAKYLHKYLSLASVFCVFTDTIILCGYSWMNRIKKWVIFQDLKALRQLVLLFPSVSI